MLIIDNYTNFYVIFYVQFIVVNFCVYDGH